LPDIVRHADRHTKDELRFQSCRGLSKCNKAELVQQAPRRLKAVQEWSIERLATTIHTASYDRKQCLRGSERVSLGSPAMYIHTTEL
jgi:hypothetical protein